MHELMSCGGQILQLMLTGCGSSGYVESRFCLSVSVAFDCSTWDRLWLCVWVKPPLLYTPLCRQYKYSSRSVLIRCVRCAGLSQPSSLALSCLTFTHQLSSPSFLFSALLSLLNHCPSLSLSQCRQGAQWQIAVIKEIIKESSMF